MKNHGIMSVLSSVIFFFLFVSIHIHAKEYRPLIKINHLISGPVIDSRSLNGVMRRPLSDYKIRSISDRVYIPKPYMLNGVTARVTTAIEYKNNLFFSRNNKVNDFAEIISPAIHFEKKYPTLMLMSDYQIDGVNYSRNTQMNQRNDGQSFLISSNYKYNRKNNIIISNHFQTFRNPFELISPKNSEGVSLKSKINQFSAENYVFQTKKLSTSFRYGYIILENDDPDYTNSYSRLYRINIDKNLSRFSLNWAYKNNNIRMNDFDNSNSNSFTTGLNYRFNDSYRWITKIGIGRSSGEKKSTDLLSELSFSYTGLRLNYKFILQRNYQETSLGTPSILLKNSFSVILTAVTASRFNVGVMVDKSRYIGKTVSQPVFSLLSLSLNMTYALDNKNHLFGKITIQNQRDGVGFLMKRQHRLLIGYIQQF